MTRLGDWPAVNARSCNSGPLGLVARSRGWPGRYQSPSMRMASQWRQLADEADEADKKPLLEKIRQTHLLREIDKAEGAIQELMALRGLTA